VPSILLFDLLDLFDFIDFMKKSLWAAAAIIYINDYGPETLKDDKNEKIP
jgi:hypothetical protein